MEAEELNFEIKIGNKIKLRGILYHVIGVVEDNSKSVDPNFNKVYTLKHWRRGKQRWEYSAIIEDSLKYSLYLEKKYK